MEQISQKFPTSFFGVQRLYQNRCNRRAKSPCDSTKIQQEIYFCEFCHFISQIFYANLTNSSFFLCFLSTVFHLHAQNPFALLCTIFLHGACVFCIPCKKSQHAPNFFAPPRLIFLHDFCEKLKISVCIPTDGYFEEIIVLLR